MDRCEIVNIAVDLHPSACGNSFTAQNSETKIVDINRRRLDINPNTLVSHVSLSSMHLILLFVNTSNVDRRTNTFKTKTEVLLVLEEN